MTNCRALELSQTSIISKDVALIQLVLIPMEVMNVAVKKASSIMEKIKIPRDVLDLELGIHSRHQSSNRN